jgi:pilus assembly protein CpaE
MIVLLDPQDLRGNDVAEAIGSHHELRRVDSMSDLDGLVRGIGRAPEVVLVVAGFGGDASFTAEEIVKKYPSAGVVLLSPDIDATLLRRAMRAGLTDVIPTDAALNEIREAVDEALAHSRAQAPSTVVTAPTEQPRGKIITVFSTKGGSGKSLLAVNLAVILSREPEMEVVIVDLDLQSGDVAILLQLLPAWTIEDAARNSGRLDEEAVQGYLTSHRSGVRLLAAPLDPAMSEVVTPDAVHQLLAILSRMFDYVIVDGPGFFTDQILAALDDSNDTVLVGSLDVPSIKNLKLALQTLGSLGIARDRIHVVLNRADSHVGLKVPEVEKSLGTGIDISIPSSRDVPLSVNQGAPIAASRPKSAVTRSIEELADLVRSGGRASATTQSDDGGRRFRIFGKE